MLAVSIVPFLVLLIWLAVIVYAISLVRRVVFATERIAAALERSRPDGPRLS